MYLRLDSELHRRPYAPSQSQFQSKLTKSMQYRSQDSDLDPRARFVDGLGVGQVASRQALVAPYLGDIQLGISDQRGMLEVEIVQARHLHARADFKRLPCEYIGASFPRSADDLLLRCKWITN